MGFSGISSLVRTFLPGGDAPGPMFGAAPGVEPRAEPSAEAGVEPALGVEDDAAGQMVALPDPDTQTTPTPTTPAGTSRATAQAVPGSSTAIDTRGNAGKYTEGARALGGALNANPDAPEAVRQPSEMALANLAFYADNPDNAILPVGFKRLQTDADLAPTGLKATDLTSRSGYEAAVFFDSRNNRYVYANRGSNSGRDFFSNLSQGLGLGSPQHSAAIANAQKIAAATGGRVVFTGTSLGGGLASAQAYETGAPAIVFNPAGLSPQTLSAAGQQRMASNPGLVTAYVMQTDPLNGAQDLGDALTGGAVPDAVGQRITIKPPAGAQTFDIRSNHGLGNMALAFAERLNA